MGKTVGTTASLDAVLGLVTRSVPMWATLFMSEVDGFHDDRAALPCNHKCVRHYPGVGSCAMMLVVNKSMQNFVKSIRWRGRCGAVHLYQAVSPTLQGFNIFCVGVHGGHGDLFSDTLADLAFLLKFRPFRSQVIILGDWNVDLLASLACDPWLGMYQRSAHHLEQRAIFDTFFDQFRFDLSIPGLFGSILGGPFGQF